MEFLLFHFANMVPRVDRVFQRRLRAVIPDLERLLAEPVGVLSRQEIVIGPLRRFLLAGFFALVATAIPGGLLALAAEEQARMHPEATRESVILILAGWAVVMLIITVLLERMLRGATLVVRKHGVVFRRRGRSVFVPWSAFAVPHAAPTTNDWWILPVPYGAKEAVLMSRDGHLIARGQNVSASQFYFRRGGDAVVVNLYGVKFDELRGFLVGLAARIGDWKSKPVALEIGEPVADEYC